ncbi:MAG TPA: DedA family protein [Solirubrobacteraceae bacterium]|nr:DedA family protein [Solirubrobacteraceae bacterium]
MVGFASLSGPLVDAATSVIGSLGLVGIFVLMLLESACIPVPSEATMLFAGFGVTQGRFGLAAVVIAGVTGNLVGSWLAFAAGFYGRQGLLDRAGSRSARHLARADRFFARYGSGAVLLARVLPVVRTFISLPAGAARMPFGRFTALTTLGCVPWVALFAILGDLAGRSWRQWHDNLQYLDYGVALAIVAGLAVLAFRTLRARPG